MSKPWAFLNGSENCALRIAECGIPKMVQDELKDRTKKFALRCVKLAGTFPNTFLGRHVGGQLMRSASSVAANYRAACRPRSTADFIAKLGIVEEEADETAFWIEFAVEAQLVNANRVADLRDEANQLVAIIVASIRTARRRKR